MPSSSSSSLNRVTGSTPSNIAGQLNSNGKVLLINPNGVVISPTGVINTKAFTASSLDINNKDFLNGKYKFEGNGNSKGVENNGTVSVGGSGSANFFGAYVSNKGIVNAKLGKILLGAGEKITLDLDGDGLMNIILTSEQLSSVKDLNGNTLQSLVYNNGKLAANGGIVQLSAGVAESLSMNAINTGASSEIYASTINKKTGKIVIGGKKNNFISLDGKISTSGLDDSNAGKIEVSGNNIYQGASIYATGFRGGKIDILSEDILIMNGEIQAKGLKDNGGSLIVMSENSLYSSSDSKIDVSGYKKGGRIQAECEAHQFPL